MKARIAAAASLLVLCVGIYFVTWGGWRQMTVGAVTLRYHVLTGRMEIQRNGKWEPPFPNLPRAPIVPARQLESVSLDSLSWGVGGLLVGRATCDNDMSVRGRIGISIRIQEPNGILVRERTLRVTADWPAGATSWFVLDTGLSAPKARQKTIVSLESIE